MGLKKDYHSKRGKEKRCPKCGKKFVTYVDRKYCKKCWG